MNSNSPSQFQNMNDSNRAKWVYLFHEGSSEMRDLLGGKGAGLSEMTNAGLPVPPGFIITTEACNAYTEANQEFPGDLWEQIQTALSLVQEQSGKIFGDPENPLLVSVRSGARVSMPGMMDTILNLGLNDLTVRGLTHSTGNPQFALDSYRRFIQMFSKVVLGLDSVAFEKIIADKKSTLGAIQDSDLSADALSELCQNLKTSCFRKQEKHLKMTLNYNSMKL